MSTFDSSPFESLPGGSSSRGEAFFDGLKRGLGVGGGKDERIDRRSVAPSKADWENAARMKWFEHQLGQHGETTAHARAKERHEAAMDAFHQIAENYEVDPRSIKTDFGSAAFAKRGKRSQSQMPPEQTPPENGEDENDTRDDVVNLDDPPESTPPATRRPGPTVNPPKNEDAANRANESKKSDDHLTRLTSILDGTNKEPADVWKPNPRALLNEMIEKGQEKKARVNQQNSSSPITELPPPPSAEMFEGIHDGNWHPWPPA